MQVLAKYVEHMLKEASVEKDQQKVDYYHSIKAVLPWSSTGLLDEAPEFGSVRVLESLADAFQCLLQPLRTEQLKRLGNKKLVRYKDLLRKLKQEPIAFATFRDATEPALRETEPESSMAAVIFGINNA